MEHTAISKNVKMSPRKVRLVANAVKNLDVTTALNKLEVLQKRAAKPVKKTLQSAMANAEVNHGAKRDSLSIKEIKVDEGIRYKRYRYAGRGRIHPYIRRASHISIILKENKPEPKTKKTETKKKGESKKE